MAIDPGIVQKSACPLRQSFRKKKTVSCKRKHYALGGGEISSKCTICNFSSAVILCFEEIINAEISLRECSSGVYSS